MLLLEVASRKSLISSVDRVLDSQRVANGVCVDVDLSVPYCSREVSVLNDSSLISSLWHLLKSVIYIDLISTEGIWFTKKTTKA